MEIKVCRENPPICSIMYLDEEVCKINRKTGEVIINNPNKLPFGIYLEESDEFDDRINNRANFEHWCATRTLTLDRTYAKEILNEYGFKQAISDADRAEISIATKGLSLIDSYWIKPEGVSSVITWEDINLFKNSLSKSMVDVALSGSPTMTNKDLITPDISTSGVFPKAWVRTKDGFELYKGDVNNSVKKEVEASRILKDMGFRVLPYEQGVYNEKPVAICKCLTTEQTSLATAIDVSIWSMNEGLDFEEFNSKWQESYDAMNLADYLIGNTDRHQENWGFYYTAPERKIIGTYPLMDFNHAFEANELTRCLPEALFGRNRTQEDVAYQVYSKYHDVLKHNLQIDFSKYEYGSYVKQRIEKLEERYLSEHQIESLQEKDGKSNPFIQYPSM